MKAIRGGSGGCSVSVSECRRRDGTCVDRSRHNGEHIQQSPASAGIRALFAKNPPNKSGAPCLLTVRDWPRAAAPVLRSYAARPALKRLEAELPPERLAAAPRGGRRRDD